MRSLIPILVLLAAAAGLLVLVLQQEEAPDGDLPLNPEPAPRAATDPSSGGGAGARPRSATVEAAPPGAWKLVLVRGEEAPPAVQDPRILRTRRVLGASDEDWTPTGAQALEILEREAAPGLRFLFQDEAALEEFRAARWPNVLPGRFTLPLLLGSFRDVGFEVVAGAEAFYVVRIRDL